MTDSGKFIDKLYTPRIREVGRIFFYIGLFCEIMIFLWDRSDWIDPIQSYLFRITFIFFTVKCICTRYSKREWIFIALLAVFGIFTYRSCGKDEVVRACVFMIAMKDMDLKRTLNFVFYLSTLGIFMLGILSVLGLLGNVGSIGAYSEKAGVYMLEFGLGSSNTWAIQIWLLAALFVFLYHDRMRRIEYPLILLLGIIVYILRKCRTALIMFVFTVFLGLLGDISRRFRESLITYLAGILITLASIAFSVYAAATSKWWEDQTEFELFLNRITTGRIQSIYPFENGGGVLSNWKLFGDPGFTEYFDMGFVRLFWWFGIIPGILAVISVIVLIIYYYRQKDYAAFELLISMVVFTVLEAHFISPFIARSWFLFMAGAAWPRLLSSVSDRGYVPHRHIAFYIGSLSKGGAERVFINLAGYFLSAGYDVTMITQYIRENEYPLPDGATRVVSDLTEEEMHGRIFNFFARIMKLHRIIRDTDADLLMTTIGKANFMAIVCSAFLPTRVVVSVVAEPTLEYPTPIMKLLLQVLFGDADGIVMQTHRQQLFLRYGLRKASVILPNSVNPAFDRERYEGERKLNVYTVGRLDENKNQAMAIDAFGKVLKAHPDAKLILCGEGPQKASLIKRAGDAGIEDRCEFAGQVSNVADRLTEAYAFVLTSDTEGMPNTLLEAMSLGIACISTDCPCGGPAEMIENGKNGILVGVRDSDALARALINLMDDPAYADALDRSARDTMKAYRPEAVNRKWREYFDGIMAL